MIIEKEKEADPGQVAKFGGLWRWGHQNSWQFNLRLSDQSNVFISRESQLRHRPHARCDAVRREFLSFSLLQLHCRRFPLFFFCYFVVLYIFLCWWNDDCCGWWWYKHSKSLGPPLAENSAPLRQRPFASESPINTARRGSFRLCRA